MRPAVHRLLALVLLALVGSAPVLAQDLPEAVEASLQAHLATGDHPSVVVGVIDAEGTRIYPYGTLSHSDATVPEADTRYEIGSITKVITALLLADAVERGEVALDDPISEYLPDSVDAPEGVTLAHLADHTSGLPRMPSNLAPADPTDPFGAYTSAKLHALLDGFTLARQPGEAYEYSNLGAGLLGHLLARRAGTSFDALARERVLVPLGLTDTGMTATGVASDPAAGLAPGHSGGREVPNWTFDALAGAGALRSTPADMLRFLGAHLAPEETPLASAIALVTQPRAHAAVAGGDSMSVGLGWHFRASDAGRIVWHNGGTGGYRSFVGYLPEAGRGVVVLTNGDSGLDDVGFHLLDPSIPLAEIAPVVDVPAEVLAGYVGRYTLAPGMNITVSTEGGRLYAQVTGQPTFRVYPSSAVRFFYKVVEAEIEFTVGEDGVATSLTLFQNGLEIPGAKAE